jgi:hypothetical protein
MRDSLAPLRTVAALYVETGGCYFGLPGVDPWDKRATRACYDGPGPVVAHPPCQRWGKLWAGQPLWIKRTGIRKVKGDDGGCFAAALAAVRQYGGILEHPWGSHAWPHFGLNRPPREGGLDRGRLRRRVDVLRRTGPLRALRAQADAVARISAANCPSWIGALASRGLIPP